MAKRGKRYIQLKEKVDRDKYYDPEEAFEILKELANNNFDETVELSVKLGVDPRHADQQIRGAVTLPHGTGKDKKVVVFAKGEKAREAQEAGAEEVGVEELIEKIQEGWLDFDAAVATPDVMNQVGKLGRVLGPRGLMPNPKAGTVTQDVGKAVSEIKAGKVEYRTDRSGNINMPIGKISFTPQQLLDNFYTVIDVLMKSRPSSAKGQYFRSIAVSNTMSPSVKINIQRALALGKTG